MPRAYAGLNSCCLPTVGIGCLVNVAIAVAALAAARTLKNRTSR